MGSDGMCCACGRRTVGGVCPNDPDYWNGPCAHGYSPYRDCDICKPLDADLARKLAEATDPSKPLDQQPTGPPRARWRSTGASWLRRLAWPVLQLRQRHAARKHRAHLQLVEDLAEEVHARLEAGKAEREQKDMRLQIALAPDTWPGGTVRCSRGDGGCGFRQKFGPLYPQRKGDRTHWIMRCPNGACKKKRVMLSLTPSLEALRKAALDEFKRKGVPTGPACREYQQAVASANRQRFAARTDDPKQPGPRPVAAEAAD
jgi:hypothetical protein